MQQSAKFKSLWQLFSFADKSCPLNIKLLNAKLKFLVITLVVLKKRFSAKSSQYSFLGNMLFLSQTPA